MASDHDRSVSPQPDSPKSWQEPLPPRPNLEMQQKRAKDLLRAVWARDPEALARLRAVHPKPPEADALKLADAQLVVARGYGFESWAALKRRIEAMTLTPRDQFRRAIDAGDVEAARTCSPSTQKRARR